MSQVLTTPANTLVLREIRKGVTRLTLNAPESRNALSRAMMAALQTALLEAAKDDQCRVLVIAAAGKVFSAGHDLKELMAARQAPDGGRAFCDETFSLCGDLMCAISAQPQIVVAEIQGLATAAGCQLAATCDLSVASSAARFATPGVDIGLFCSTPMVALTRAIPKRQALEMLFTGKPIDAVEAHRLGLVNRVVQPENLTAETLALADLIASKPAAILGLGKRAFAEQDGLSLSDAYQKMSRVMTENMALAEAREGIAAFVERRAPNWPS